MKKLFSILFTLVLCLCFVGCGDSKEEIEKKEVEQLAKGLIVENNQIEQNTELVNKVGGVYKVTWTLEENDRCTLEENDGVYTIVILENTEWSDELELVATVHGLTEGIEASKTFKIYARKKVAEEYTISEFIDNEIISSGYDGQVSGTVYFTTSTGFWLTDGSDAHLYVYGSGYTVKVGNEVTVVGEKKLYFSMVEMIDAAVTVTNDKEGFDLTTMTQEGSIELLNDYMPATSNDKINPAYFGGIYTIEGTIVTNDVGATDVYTYALESAITSEKVVLYDSQFADGDADNLKANFGKYVKFTCMYWDMYSDGFIRIIPIGEITQTEKPGLTDEQIVAKVEESINSINKEFVVSTTLPTKLDGATISWESDKPEVLSNEGKILKQVEEDVEVKLTATITLNEITKTVEVTVKVMLVEEKSALEATQIALEGIEETIKVKGKIIGLDTTSKKYFYIADETGITFVRTSLDTIAPEGVELQVGDSVELIAKTTVYYNNNKEITPQLNAIACVKLEEEIAVIEAETITMEQLKRLTSESTLQATEIDVISKNALYGKLIKVECYVQVRTSGNYTNAYLVPAADTSTTDTNNTAYYQHSSFKQDEVIALDGQKVVIVCPVYGYSATYGWRLGTYISLDVVE